MATTRSKCCGSTKNPWLPNNRLTAVDRPSSLRRRLSPDEQLWCKCWNFMDDLVTKRYARKLTEDETAARSPRTWYLPHHSVFHPHDGISLNSLLGVLLRFRQEHIVHCTCGRHTLYVPSGESTCQGHHALCFLWWEDTDFPKSPEEHHMVSCILAPKIL